MPRSLRHLRIKISLASAQSSPSYRASLQTPLDELAAESHPVMRLHRMCDASEILTRFSTGFREYLKEEGVPSDEDRIRVSRGPRRPRLAPCGGAMGRLARSGPPGRHSGCGSGGRGVRNGSAKVDQSNADVRRQATYSSSGSCNATTRQPSRGSFAQFSASWQLSKGPYNVMPSNGLPITTTYISRPPLAPGSAMWISCQANASGHVTTASCLSQRTLS